MTVMDQATPIDGWMMAKDECPPKGVIVEILHFGNSDPIPGFGSVDDWGICPHSDDGGHAKRSTITHWRHRK